jgi:hypothetical protein
MKRICGVMMSLKKMKTKHIFYILATYPLLVILPVACSNCFVHTKPVGMRIKVKGMIQEKKIEEIFPNVLDEQPAIYKIEKVEKNNKKFSF